MKRIARHDVDRDLAKRIASDDVETLQVAVDAARTKPSSLNSLHGTALDQAARLLVTGADLADVCKHLRLAGQAAAAIFAAASAKDEVTCPLGDGPPARLPRTGPTGSTDVDNWLYGFSAAAVVRDRRSLDVLCSTPMEVIRGSSSRADECVYLTIEALASLWRRDQGIGARLIAALEASDPERLKIAPEYVLRIVVPAVGVFAEVLSTAPAIDERLVTALENHKKYWGKADHRVDPHGFVAWPLLAGASFAHDAEIEIAVESDYLPRDLYRGACA